MSTPTVPPVNAGKSLHPSTGADYRGSTQWQRGRGSLEPSGRGGDGP